MSTLDALLALDALAQLPRTGWVQAGVPHPESVAAHSLGVALLALALGPRVAPPLDVERAVALAVIHDAPEALLSDLPRAAAELLPEGAKASAEAVAAERLLGPLSEQALERYREYAEGATREARFARVCDRLHMGLKAVALARSGQRGLESFRATLEELDCADFPPCEELLRVLLRNLA